MGLSKRVCPVCGTAFAPAVPNQRYCPPTDADRERREKSQPRSQCAKRASNHTQRLREGRETIPLTAPLPAPFACAQCRKRCVPGENVAPHATKFCGRPCKRAWHHEREQATA